MLQFATARWIALLGLFALTVMLGAVAATDVWLRQLSEDRTLAVARRDAAMFRSLYLRLPEPERTDALFLAVPAFALQARAARGDIGAGQAVDADPCGAADRDRTVVAAWFERPVVNSAGFTGPLPATGIIDWPRLRTAPAGTPVRFTVAADIACNHRQTEAIGVVERIGDVQLVVGGLMDRETAVRNRVWLAGALAALLVGAAVCLAVVLVTRQTARRMRELSDVLARAGEGDFAARASDSGAAGEFAILGTRINAAIERLAAQNRGLREIAARIAHDFQGPLTLAQFKLEDMVRAAATPEAQASAEAASAALDELSRGFRAYLEVGEITGGMVRAFGPVDLSAALIERAISNLISNAVKFSPDGGRILVRLMPAGEGVVLEIEDEGTGWPADLDASLGRFGVRSERAAGGGHGVGLASVIAIMAHHGGQFERRSAPAGGAVARLIWPSVIEP
jgi:signal transduction histidine kinase